MKKGFTLVEIIISISIIVIIGATSTFFFVQKNKKEETEITKKVLESASVYIETEVDDYGNTYKTGILSGGKGVQLSVQNLIDKGYIKEDEIEKLNDDPNDLYILAALTTSDESLCGEGNIEYTVSWDTSKKDPVYLCGYKGTTPNKNLLFYLENGKNANLKFSKDKIPVSEAKYTEILDNNPDKIDYFTKDENGIFSYFNEDTKNIYTFYRGVINNNYVELGEKDGKKLLWRIIWVRDDNTMKLALDETIPTIRTTTDGEVYEMQEGEMLERHSNNEYSSSHTCNKYHILLPGDKTSTRYNKYHNSKKIFQEDFRFKGIDDTSLDYWYEKTNLDTFTYIKESDSFCKNSYYIEESSYKDEYIPSTNFDCITGKNTQSYISTEQYLDKKIGLLTYGDVYMGGILNKYFNLDEYKENFLFSDKKYWLADFRLSYLTGSLNEEDYYIVSPTIGITNELIWATITNSDDSYYRYSFDGTLMCEFYSRYTIQTKHYDMKPAIMIDLNKATLSNSDGTKTNPYTLISKT